MSTRLPWTRYPSPAATAAAGACAATGARSPPSATKTMAAVSVEIAETAVLNAVSNHGAFRLRAAAMRVLAPATTRASHGANTSAAANVPESSTVIFIFWVRWSGRSWATVANPTRATASGTASNAGASTSATAGSRASAPTSVTYSFRAGRIADLLVADGVRDGCGDVRCARDADEHPLRRVDGRLHREARARRHQRVDRDGRGVARSCREVIEDLDRVRQRRRRGGHARGRVARHMEDERHRAGDGRLVRRIELDGHVGCLVVHRDDRVLDAPLCSGEGGTADERLERETDGGDDQEALHRTHLPR